MAAVIEVHQPPQAANQGPCSNNKGAEEGAKGGRQQVAGDEIHSNPNHQPLQDLESTQLPEVSHDETNEESITAQDSIARLDNQQEASNVDEEQEEEQDEEPHDDDDDDGDPIPSGTGSVNKYCSASELLGWSEILPKWHAKLSHRPKGLNALVRNGIPDPLRGEVWQLLAGAQESALLMDRYRIFLTMSAPTEQIILRDVHRTYPAHENFRSDAGSSSLLDSLFKVCKAYAVYDEEVGYCQGLSFLVAALLLHMPEEQAFCVFVRVMQYYGLRDLFRSNFDELYLKFYQLEQLLQDQLPDLHQHFVTIGIEPFTYASQWFLTVFTAKFPLNAVFYILDIFLLDGMNTIFQIAMALLSSSKADLLALDFEGVLKYFRVQMPKRYRNQDNVLALIKTSSVISLKKLKRYAKNYELAKQKEKLLENPVSRLQRDHAKLAENNLRLEQENDDLARDLVASKIQLRAQIDQLEDKNENLNMSLQICQQNCKSHLNTISDMEDERARLEVEVNQLKEVCRRELKRAESESVRDNNIITDYKKICSQLSKRLDHQRDEMMRFVEVAQDMLRDNESYPNGACFQLFRSQVNGLKKILNSDFDDPEKQPGRETCEESQESSPTQSVEAKMEKRSPISAYIRDEHTQRTSSDAKIKHLNEHVDELEVELARTKLALVEAQCKCQQLTHDLNVGVSVKCGGSSTDQLGGGLASKLEYMKAAVVSAGQRSPKSTSKALAKINNLISEKISNINFQSSSLNSSSTSPHLHSKSTGTEGNINKTLSNIANGAENQC